MVKVELDAGELERLQASVASTPGAWEKAVNIAVRRTQASARKQISKGLKPLHSLRRVTALRRRIKNLRADVSRNQAGLWVGLNPLGMSEFQGRPKRSAQGISFRGKEYKGAFFGRLPSGKSKVMERTGKERLPIREVGVDIYEKSVEYLEDSVVRALPDYFMHHLENQLNREWIK